MNHNQLFCFTYAGGTSAFFDEIEKDLSGIEVVKFEYAGHGNRRKENYYQDFNELADDMLRLFKESYKGGHYSLFGYSMGTISLVETLKRIIKAGFELPSNIFLASHEPHTKSELLGYKANELDEWVKKRTIQFGVVPKQLESNDVFWRTYLPLYRTDFGIIAKYDFDKLDIKLNIPTVVFYSETDTPLKDMKQWEKYFPCEFYQFDGPHFFIRQHHKEMGIIIKSKIGE